MKKRLRAAALGLLLCLVLTSCKGSGNGTEQPKGASKNARVFFDPFMGNATMSESFAFIPNLNNTGAQYFDAASRTAVLFCFEPNCEQIGPKSDFATGENIGDTCASKCLGSHAYYLTEDAGYYFEWPNLVKTDRQGLNQKTIATVEEPIDFVEYEWYTNEYYAATVMINYAHTKVVAADGTVTWLQGEPLEKRISGVIMVSLKDGSSRFIYRDEDRYDSIVTDLYEYQNHLYFVGAYLDAPYESLRKYNADMSDWGEVDLENQKHLHLELYDYDIARGKLTMIRKSDGEGYGYRFGDGYLLQYANPLTGEGSMLYRLNGEVLCELPWKVTDRVITDGTPILTSWDSGAATYRMYDTDKKEVLREISISGGRFGLSVAVGDSYYGHMYTSWSNGNLEPAYISAEDFWNGEFDKAIVLSRPPEE